MVTVEVEGGLMHLHICVAGNHHQHNCARPDVYCCKTIGAPDVAMCTLCHHCGCVQKKRAEAKIQTRISVFHILDSNFQQIGQGYLRFTLTLDRHSQGKERLQCLAHCSCRAKSLVVADAGGRLAIKRRYD